MRPHPEYAIHTNCPCDEKGHKPPRKNTSGNNKVDERSYTPHLWKDDFKPYNYRPLKKRRLRKDLGLTHKILHNHLDLEATQLYKFSSRTGLRRSSIRLLHRTEGSRRRRNNFAWWVNISNRLPLSVASVTKQREFKKKHSTHIFTQKLFDLSYILSNMVFLGTILVNTSSIYT